MDFLFLCISRLCILYLSVFLVHVHSFYCTFCCILVTCQMMAWLEIETHWNFFVFLNLQIQCTSHYLIKLFLIFSNDTAKNGREARRSHYALLCHCFDILISLKTLRFQQHRKNRYSSSRHLGKGIKSWEFQTVTSLWKSVLKRSQWILLQSFANTQFLEITFPKQ